MLYCYCYIRNPKNTQQITWYSVIIMAKGHLVVLIILLSCSVFVGIHQQGWLHATHVASISCYVYYSITQEICTRFPYPSGLLHWHCGNLTIAPVPAKQPWWIWINTSCEFIMNDCITTTKQSTTKPCAYFLGYTVWMDYGDGQCTSESWWCHDMETLCALLFFCEANPPNTSVFPVPEMQSVGVSLLLR